MISHVVLIRLKPDVDVLAADRFLGVARNVLDPIPAVRKLRVG